MHPRVRRVLPVASLAGLTLVWAWVVWSSTGRTDRSALTAEVTATAVLGLTALLAPTPRARWTIGAVAGWVGLTALADSYWLLTAGAPSVGYAQGSAEPVPSVVLFLLRHPVGAAALALALPQHGRRRTRRAAVGEALDLVQVAAGAVTLVALAPSAGGLLGDRGPSSTFLGADLLLGGTAAVLALRALRAGSTVPRRARRLLVATALSVLGLAVGDAVTVVALLRASPGFGLAGYSLCLAACVLCVAAHLRDHGDPATTACLPPAAGAAGRSRPAVRVLTRLLVPAAVLVLTTHRLSTGQVPPPHQLGLVGLTLVLSLFAAVRQLVRAERDERSAATVVRDHLTGAWSRAGLVEQLTVRRSSGRRDGPRTWTVVVLDLDGFKAVNDTHGHAAGDAVLRATVARTAAVVGDQGLLARLGGDEFVLVLPTSDRRAEETDALVAAVLAAVSTPLELPGGAVCRVGTSAGTADVDVDGWDGGAAGLLEEADRRMYRDKRARHRTARGPSPTDPLAAVPN